MNYYELVIGGETYKLRLTTRGCITMEKALGCNPLQIFMDVESGKLPKLTDLVVILQVMLQQLNHGISLDKAYDLFDCFLAEGHTMFDLIPIFMEVFQNAGFISKTDNTEDEKN